jgi:hypothetical protein
MRCKERRKRRSARQPLCRPRVLNTFFNRSSGPCSRLRLRPASAVLSRAIVAHRYWLRSVRCAASDRMRGGGTAGCVASLRKGRSLRVCCGLLRHRRGLARTDTATDC